MSQAHASGWHLEFDFLHIQLQVSGDHKLEAVEANHQLINLDAFAVDRAIGCAASLSQQTSDGTNQASELNNPFPSSGGERRFSFKARLTQPGGQVEERTVVYEGGALDMLRVDERGCCQTTSTSLLLDFDLGHLYHLIERGHKDECTPMHMLRVAADQASNSCILTELPARAKVKPTLLYHFERLLLGALGNTFLYLGAMRARLRVLQFHLAHLVGAAGSVHAPLGP